MGVSVDPRPLRPDSGSPAPDPADGVKLAGVAGKEFGYPRPLPPRYRRRRHRLQVGPVFGSGCC